MSSAKTVAQKPVGSVNPLSSFGHAEFMVFDPGLEWFWAEIEVVANHRAAKTTNEDADRRRKRIETSGC
jgi:hypothetical protein